MIRRFALGAIATLALSVAACSGTGTTLPAAPVSAANAGAARLTAQSTTATADSAHALAAATATPDSAHALAAATATPDSAHALAAASQTPMPVNTPVAVAPVPQHAVCAAATVRCASHRSNTLAAQPSPQRPPSSSQALGPADLRALYGLSGSGSGKTIAIVDATYDPQAESDLGVYRAAYGLPACTTGNGCFRAVYFRSGIAAAVNPATATADPDWAQEISLDLDVASAACPQCKILLLQNDQADIDQLALLNDAAVALGASVISNSYGAAENATLAADEVHFNHPGIPITASAGDAGSVSYPASSQYVTAVGGTEVVRAWGHEYEQRWSMSGAGCSAIISRPAWQSQNAACATRSMPDIAVTAGLDPGVAVYDSVPGPDGSYGWIGIGGTSVGAPLVAAMYALGDLSSVGTGASHLYAKATNTTVNPVLDPAVTYTASSLQHYAKSYPVLTDLSTTGLGSPHGMAIFQH